MIAPEFTPRIDLGHLIQAAILVVTIGGGGIGGYLALDGRISAQAERLAGLQERVQQDRIQIMQVQEEQRHTSEKITTSLAKLGEQLTDLRLLVAKDKR